MAVTRTVRQTVTALVKSFQKDIQAAAGDTVISKAEEAKLSPFVQSHIDEIRKGNKPVTVKAAVSHLKPIIERAAQSIAGSDGKIDAKDVLKLRVPDLRNRAVSLFDGAPVVSGKRAGVEKALKDIAADTQIGEFGRSFGMGDYAAASEDPMSIVGKETDTDMSDFTSLADYGTVLKGAAAVKAFATTLTDASKDAANDQTGAEKRQTLSEFNALATQTKAFFNPADFKQIVGVFHETQEDGDIEYNVLMAQKKDGAWVALTYANNPF